MAEDEPGDRGWKEYVTWFVKLWINNDGACYRHQGQLAVLHPHRDDLAKALKAWITGGNPLPESNSIYSDMLGSALDNVDWDEIAEHVLEDVRGETPM